jgi:hypothetical protein
MSSLFLLRTDVIALEGLNVESRLVVKTVSGSARENAVTQCYLVKCMCRKDAYCTERSSKEILVRLLWKISLVMPPFDRV